MNLESLERERIKVYKDYLRQQVQKHAKQRKQQNNYQRKKQEVDMNQLINRLNEDDIRRLQQRRNTAILLKQHNSGLSNLRKSGIYPDEHQQNGLLNNNSFLDHINKKDVERIHKNKQGYVHNWQENQMQENFRRNREERDRSLEREEEGKHMDRLKAMELESRKNYQQIKRKHEQNMKIYDMHSNLMHENQQYRRMAQKFTQCEDDIISRLKRNQSAERKRNLKFNQDVLKHQMDEYNERRSLQRSQILQGQDIDASIFKNLLHGSPNYKKQYGQQLKSQMSEMETRKVGEKYALKEKYKIGGIFGGEHGREREQQIKYVDRKLGLRKGESYNREVQLDRSKQLNHARRSISVNNEEEEQYRNPPKYVPEKSTQYEQYQPQQQRQSIYQPLEPQIQRQLKQSQNSPPPPPTVSTNQPQLQSPPSIPFQQKISITPRNNAYGLPYNESPSNRYQQQQQQQAQKKFIPIAAGDPGVAYRNGNQNGADKKLFRSFDLVTGQNRFYG